MYNLLKCEILKLKSSKLFKYMFIAICSISALFTICEIIGLERYRTPETTDMRLSLIDTFASKLMFPDIVILIVSIFTIAFICHDFSERIVQSAVCSGCSKFKILLSKVITCYIVLGLFMLVNAIIGAITTFIVYRYIGNFILYHIFDIFKLYFISILLSCGIISIAIMCAYIYKSTGAACIAYITIMFVYIYLPRLIQDVYNVEESARQFTLPELCEQLYLDMTTSFICNSIFQSLVYIIVFFFITYAVFKRSELK